MKGQYLYFLNVRPRPLRYLRGRHYTARPRDFLAVPEQDHGGNAADPVTVGDLLFGFGIELAETELGFERTRRSLELRCHHLAWPAPFRPEIDEQGQIGIGVSVETGGGQCDWPALEQGGAAAAAAGVIRQSFLRNAIDGTTFRASNGGILFSL